VDVDLHDLSLFLNSLLSSTFIFNIILEHLFNICEIIEYCLFT
jgi:hypothetical protein